MTPHPSTRNSPAGCQPSSGMSNGPACSVANPSHVPVAVRSLPHSHPVRPSRDTGLGGTTRLAPGRDSAADNSRSSSSLGVGVHTVRRMA